MDPSFVDCCPTQILGVELIVAEKIAIPVTKVGISWRIARKGIFCMNPAALLVRSQDQVMVVTNWNKEQSMLVNQLEVFLNELESIAKMLSRGLRIVTW